MEHPTATGQGEIALTVNGAERRVPAAWGDETLLDTLREQLGLVGAKYGCGIAACGACTVHVDGAPVTACRVRTADASGRSIVTIEGLGAGGLHRLQRAWLAERVPQCGYCQPGQLMQAAALLASNPDPVLARKVALVRGVIASRRNRHPDSLALLRPLDGQLADRAETGELSCALAESETRQGEPTRALRALAVLESLVSEGASWLPTDGYLDPSRLTYALADGARRGGCAIHLDTRVVGIDVHRGRVHRVRTDRGDIEADVVVNAGGMYAAEIGRLAGVRVPVVPFAHEYLVTQPFRDRDGGHLPTLRDPDHLVYFREEGGGLVMGGYERHSAPWALAGGAGLDAIPPDFNGRLLEEDWDRFEEIVGYARLRVPAMEDVRVTRLINGPEAFTPDGEFCLGETEVRGLFVAAGFCAHGLAGAGGVMKGYRMPAPTRPSGPRSGFPAAPGRGPWSGIRSG